MIKQLLDGLADLTESSEIVQPDIVLLKFTVVNAFLVSGENCAVLIDTGLESSCAFILETAESLAVKPSLILLTHGHFDHVGSVKKLSDAWGVPVYAHELEMPYLTGRKAYPKGQPEADEGLIAKLSAHFPEQPIDLGERLLPLPADGAVPGLPEWQWLPTPGHTPGHVSLFRSRDSVLIAGDAITGTKQESLKSVLTQERRLKGPPAYFTPDWDAAEESVRRLRDLLPKTVLFSHGRPLSGDVLEGELDYLVQNFDEAARPHRL